MLDWERIKNKDKDYLSTAINDVKTSTDRDSISSIQNNIGINNEIGINDKIDREYEDFKAKQNSKSNIDWDSLINNATYNEKKGEINRNRYDIAQKNSIELEEDNRNLIQKGADWVKDIVKPSEKFEDGYQFGDITSTASSTASRAGMSVAKGVMNVGEKVGDLGLGLVAICLDALGKKDIAQNLKNNVSLNAVDEFFNANVNFGDSKTLNSIQNITKQLYETSSKNSVIGENGDKILESAGFTLGILGLQSVGVSSLPIANGALNMPVGSIITGAGAGIEESFQKGYNNWQTLLNATQSGLIEGFTEGLFSSKLGIGGGTIEDKIEKATVGKIKNSIAKTFAKIGMDATEESAEEFISYFLNWGATHIEDFAKNAIGLNWKDMSEDWNWDEVMDSMATAFFSTVLSTSSPQIRSDSKFNKTIGKETNFEIANWNENDIVSSDIVRGNYVPTNHEKLNRNIAVVQKDNGYVAIDIATGTELDLIRDNKEEAVEQIQHRIENLTDEEIQSTYKTLFELDSRVEKYLAQNGRLKDMPATASEARINSYVDNEITNNRLNLSEQAKSYYTDMLKMYSINKEMVKEEAPVLYKQFQEKEKKDKSFKNWIKELSQTGEKESLSQYNKIPKTNIDNSSNEVLSPEINQTDNTNNISTSNINSTEPKTDFYNQNDKVVISEIKTPQNSNMKQLDITSQKSTYKASEKSTKTSDTAKASFNEYVKMQKSKNNNYEAEIVTEITKPQKFIQDFLKDTYNQEVVYYKENMDSGIEHVDTSNPKVIYVNTDLSKFTSNGVNENNQLLFAIFHGFGHNIKELYPEQYKELVKIIENSMTEEQKQKYLDTFEGEELNKMLSNNDALIDEIIADHLGDASTDMNFWQSLQEKAKDIYNAIVERIKALYNYLTKDYEGIELFASQKQSAEMKEKLEDILNYIAKDVQENKSTELETAKQKVKYNQDGREIKDTNYVNFMAQRLLDGENISGIETDTKYVKGLSLKSKTEIINDLYNKIENKSLKLKKELENQAGQKETISLDIVITKTGLKESFQKGISNEKYAVVPYLDKIIETSKNGIIRDEAKERKNIKGWYYLYNTAKIDNKLYGVKVDLKQTDRGDRLYVHRVNLLNKESLPSQAVTDKSVRDTVGQGDFQEDVTITSSLINNSITQKAKAVKSDTTVNKSTQKKENNTKKTNGGLSTEKIEDFGEKIGGARKDLSEKSVTKTSKEVIHDYRVEQTDNGYSVKFKRETLKDGFKTEAEAEKYIKEFKDSIKDNLVYVEDMADKSKYGIMKSGNRYELKIRNPRTLKSTYLGKGFDNKTEAESYAMALSMYLKEHGKNLFRPQLQKIERINPKVKNNQKATGDSILKEYGFRGGEFGNWVNNNERQEFLNYAYNSFNDLAEALDILPEDLGQNGEMSIAFGARGQGLTGAVAHFDPEKKVINMTRLKGAGSLAHEYGHSLDNLLSRRSGYTQDGMITTNILKGTLSDNLKDKINKVIYALKNSVSTDQAEIDKKNAIYEKSRKESAEYHLKTLDYLFDGTGYKYKYSRKENKHIKVPFNATSEQKKEFNKIKKKILDGKITGEVIYDSKFNKTFPKEIEALARLHKEITGRKINEDTKYWLHRYGKPATQVTEVVSESAFSKSARELDKFTGRSTAYFSKIEEMWARAFESYVYDKLKSKGITNTYLVHSVNNDRYSLFNPFPAGEERQKINKAFDDLVEAMKEEGIFHNSNNEIKNSNRKLSNKDIENTGKIVYNENGITLNKTEMQQLTSAINTDTPNLENKISSKSYGDYYYIFKKNAFNDYTIRGKLKIEGNEDIIKLLEGELNNGINGKSKIVNTLLSRDRNGQRFSNSFNDSNTERGTNQSSNSLSKGKSEHTINTRTNSKQSDGNSSEIENSNESSFNLLENNNDTKNSKRKISKKATYQEYKEARIKANVAYLNNIIKYKNRVITSLEEQIRILEYDLSKLKDQNTIKAQTMRLEIERLRHRAEQIQILYNKKIDLLSNELNKENLEAETSEYMKRDLRDLLANEIVPLLVNTENWKDKKIGFLYAREIAERNIEDIVGDREEAEKINKLIFEPVHQNQAERVRYVNDIYKRINDLKIDTETTYDYTEIVTKEELQILKSRGIDISKIERTREHQLNEFDFAMLFVENKITENELRKKGLNINRIETIAHTWQAIADEMFDRVNEVLVQHGYTPIDKRSNYVPHSVENKPDTAVAKLMAVFGIDITDNELPTDIAGLTDTFKPGKTWNRNLLERHTEMTDLDFLPIIEKYIYNMSDVIFTTSDIQRVREFSRQIRYKYAPEHIVSMLEDIENNIELTEDEKQDRKDKIYKSYYNPLSNLVTWLDDYANTLANKKSFSDRAIERMAGRRVYKIVSNIENKISKNMIVGNLSVALTNFAPVIQLFTNTKISNVMNAYFETMTSTLGELQGIKDTSYVKSVITNADFYVNRHNLEEIKKAKSKLQKIEEVASKPIEGIDKFTTEVVMRARYSENLESGLTEEEAINRANQESARIMADRSKGALPTLFNSKNPLVKMLTMFQVEVNNTLSNYTKDMRNMSKEKMIEGYTKLIVGSYFFNTMIMAVRGGNEVLLDPIRIIGYLLGAMFGDDDDKKEKARGDLSEAVMSAVPFVQSVAGLVGMNEIGRVPISSAMPDLSKIGKALDKDADTQYKVETISKEFAKVFWYLGLPFGGAQAKKTSEAVISLSKGGNRTTNKKGQTLERFSFEDTNIIDIIKAILFGQWSTRQAKEYSDNGYKSTNLSK